MFDDALDGLQGAAEDLAGNDEFVQDAVNLASKWPSPGHTRSTRAHSSLERRWTSWERPTLTSPSRTRMA